jgi:hypothetical protein
VKVSTGYDRLHSIGSHAGASHPRATVRTKTQRSPTREVPEFAISSGGSTGKQRERPQTDSLVFGTPSTRRERPCRLSAGGRRSVGPPLTQWGRRPSDMSRFRGREPPFPLSLRVNRKSGEQIADPKRRSRRGATPDSLDSWSPTLLPDFKALNTRRRKGKGKEQNRPKTGPSGRADAGRGRAPLWAGGCRRGAGRPRSRTGLVGDANGHPAQSRMVRCLPQGVSLGTGSSLGCSPQYGCGHARSRGGLHAHQTS